MLAWHGDDPSEIRPCQAGEPWIAEGEALQRLAESDEGFLLALHDGAQAFAIGPPEAPAARALAFCADGAASLGHAFTEEAHRRKGCQSALIRARLAWARERGAKAAIAETYAFLPSSFDNLLAAGFVHAYGRRIWRWENPALAGQEQAGA